jgi:hypothetical protein
MLSTPIIARMTSSDFRSTLHHFPGPPVIGVATSRSTPGWQPEAIDAGAETDLPRSVLNCAYVPIPIRRRVPRCCTSKVFTPSMAFARVRGARLPHWSAFAGTITTLTQDSSSYGPYACSPPLQATLSWGFDSRVSPSIAHQLHGCLVITMAGLSPASSTQLRGTPNAKCRNRFARTGEIADPCGVPLSRSTRVPSGCCSGAASHRLTYSSTHGQSVTDRTARTTSSQGTVSKEDTTHYPPRWLPGDGPDRAGAPSVGGPLACADRVDAPSPAAGADRGAGGRQPATGPGGVDRSGGSGGAAAGGDASRDTSRGDAGLA